MSINPFDQFGPDYISSLNNSYRDAKIKTRSSGIVPEGKYQTIVTYIALKPSRVYQNELQLAMSFEILDGEYRGTSVMKYTPIIPENMERLKTDLYILGIDLEDDVTKLGDQSTIEMILDQIVDITVKHKAREKSDGVYQNIFINRSHGKPSGDFEETEDDDNPFGE